MTSRLVDALSTTNSLAAVFDDRAVLRALLDVEVALARAQVTCGLIPQAAADAIAAPAILDRLDAGTIAEEARRSGTIVIPFVSALTAAVRASDADAAKYVHWGATSQDISDNAMLLLLARAFALMSSDQARFDKAAHDLSDRHATTVMCGRTLLQPATPTTFGLKAAGWCASARRSWRRVETSLEEARVVQLGGASGTLASLGTHGPAVAARLAENLGLRSAAPWHAHRDRLAALMADCGVHGAVLGKVARDVSLLMQPEIGEAFEPGGGSSTMPHKRNPSGSAIMLAAATRLPGLVGSFLSGMVQEHERGLGGWHAEWPTITSTVETLGSSIAAGAALLEQLTVDPERMRANAQRAEAAALSEQVMMQLAPVLGRDRAHAAVADALREAAASGTRPRDVMAALPEVQAAMPAEELGHLGEVDRYLGAAEEFRRRLLQE